LTLQQFEAFAIVAGMLGLFVSDRLRYDMVAALALSCAALTGVVPREKVFEGRWCTRRLEVEIAPNPQLLCDDRLATDGIWASSRQHPVQHRHADGSLGLLGGEAAGSQPGSDQRLIAPHCRFH